MEKYPEYPDKRLTHPLNVADIRELYDAAFAFSDKIKEIENRDRIVNLAPDEAEYVSKSVAKFKEMIDYIGDPGMKNRIQSCITAGEIYLAAR